MYKLTVILIAFLAVATALHLPEHEEAREAEVESMNPEALQYADFCYTLRGNVLNDIDLVEKSLPISALRHLYFTADQAGQREVMLTGQPGVRRSLSHTLARLIGMQNPLALEVVMHQRSLPLHIRNQATIVDSIAAINCQVFERFADAMKEKFALAKSALKGNVELEHLGCKTVNRVLRISHICEVADKAVAEPNSNFVYKPNDLFM